MALVAGIRNEMKKNVANQMVISPRVGPRGDSYFPERTLIMTEEEAEEYHSQQINWLAETEADMVISMNNNF